VGGREDLLDGGCHGGQDRRRRPTAAAPACGLPLLCRRPDTSMIWVGRPSPPPFLHGDELEQDGIEVWRWRGDEIVSLPRLASSTRTPWRRAAAAWALTSPWPPTAGAAPSVRGPLHSPVGGIGEWQQRAELLDAGPAAAPLGFCGGAGTGGEGKVLVGAGAARLRADAGGPAARWSRRRGKRGGVAREEKERGLRDWDFVSRFVRLQNPTSCAEAPAPHLGSQLKFSRNLPPIPNCFKFPAGSVNPEYKYNRAGLSRLEVQPRGTQLLFCVPSQKNLMSFSLCRPISSILESP
jgi:hypothetical protein